MHEEPSAPTARGSKVQLAAWSGDEADADNSPANAARVAGPGRINFAARPNFANLRNHGYIRYLFAILHVNPGYAR